MSPVTAPAPTASTPPTWRARLSRFVQMAMAVADADPEEVRRSARQLGSSRAYLSPVAWAAGTIVLLLRGIKLLLLNWRLTLIQIVPALVVWFAMYDVRVHALHRKDFRDLSPGWIAAIVAVCVVLCIASFWCNTVFAFAIDVLPPRIGPAIRRTNERWRPVVVAGVVLGLLLGWAVAIVPRLDRYLYFSAVLLGVIGIMVVAFVAVPARILARRQRKLPPREALGRTMVGWALSFVVMTPGFVLDRLGLILMGIPRLRLVGFIVLSVGTALYAAGMSSVKAVKLSIRLANSDPEEPSSSAPTPPSGSSAAGGPRPPAADV